MGLVDNFLIWWLRRGRYGWSRIRRRVFEGRYLNTQLPVAESLEEIESYLGQVTWAMDGPLHLFDSISYPQTVWQRKRDDCDGFAILAATLLQRWQPTTNPVLVTAITRPMRASHTVCGFNSPGGTLWFFDNHSIRHGDFHGYADIINMVKGNSRLVCWDVRNPGTLDMMEFHKM